MSMDIPHTTWLAVLCGCCSPTQDVGLLWSLCVSLALLLLWEEERDTGKGRVNPLGIFIGLEGEAGKVMLKLKPNGWKLSPVPRVGSWVSSS